MHRIATPELWQNAFVEAALVERVKTKLIPDTETTITIESGRPPFVANPAARELVKVRVGIYGSCR